MIAVLGVLCVGVMAGWVVGLGRFTESIPARVEDTGTRTDAIVVLTGGSERMRTGLQLFADRQAERVFISGVHRDVDLRQVLKLSGEAPELLQARIETGHSAKDTAGNARETAEWMRSRGYRSLRLVTGAYHMPRSLLEFRRAMPEVTVIPHPVFPDHVKQGDWWRWPGTAALIITEYNKYLLACLNHGARRLFAMVAR
jgi:uncharacterized SAM-binding protein YcdF (DUF218 family)